MTVQTASIISADVETITPEDARKMLDSMIRNRYLNKVRVNRFASDMEHGRWLENGQPIIVLNDGRTADGQHRLHAIIQSGLSQEIVVVRGVHPDAVKTMDSGAKRTVANQLQIDGFSNGSGLATVAKLVLAHENAPHLKWGSGTHATDTEIFEYAKGHAVEIAHAISLGSQVNYVYPESNSNWYAAAAVIVSQAGYEIEFAKDFHRGFLEGSLTSDDVRQTLTVAWARRGKAGGEWAQQAGVWRVLLAFDAFMGGEFIDLRRSVGKTEAAFFKDRFPMPFAE